MQSIEDHLRTIQNRLSDTLEAFVVARKINEKCNKEVDPTLNKTINKHGGFWEVVLCSTLTTQFVGIFALLDKNSTDSATLYSVLDKLKSIRPGVLPPNLTSDLDRIRDRYSKYRNKLFGHNDKNRDAVIAKFNQEGFTWESQEQDLFELEYAFKVLLEAAQNRKIPTRQEAKEMQLPYNHYVVRAATDTVSLLHGLHE
jgi:hypothetical protein